MRLKVKLIYGLVSILFFMVGSGLADEINLKNGDRITGEVIRMQGNLLVIKTVYAGEITITWEEVLKVKTDRPIKVVLKDDSLLEGVSQAFEESKMKIDSDMLKAPASFELSDVQAINPVEKKPFNGRRGRMSVYPTREDSFKHIVSRRQDSEDLRDAWNPCFKDNRHDGLILFKN